MPTRKQKSRFAGVFKGGMSENEVKKQQARSGAMNGPRLYIKKGTTKVVQFWGDPVEDDPHSLQYNQHVWNEGKRWFFIPCFGEKFNCVEDQNENERRANTSFAFIAQVWSFTDRKPMVLTGGSKLAALIQFQYKRNPERFTRRTFEISALAESSDFVVQQAEERPIRLSEKEPVDMEEYLWGEFQRNQEANKQDGPSSLDEDDDEDEFEDDEDEEETEDDEPDEDEMLDKDAWSWSDLKSHARKVGVRSDTKNRAELVRLILRKRK
jgi:hypothetical protein